MIALIVLLCRRKKNAQYIMAWAVCLTVLLGLIYLEHRDPTICTYTGVYVGRRREVTSGFFSRHVSYSYVYEFWNGEGMIQRLNFNPDTVPIKGGTSQLRLGRLYTIQYHKDFKGIIEIEQVE